MHPSDLPLVVLASRIRAGEITSEQAVREALARLEELGALLNCVLSVESEEALEQARAADVVRASGGPLGPLHGVPLAHKDIFARGGKVVTAGSPILGNNRMDGVATVLARLRAAGSIEIGSLHLAEFARSPTGYNVHYGSCRNPWDLERVTGGSSSGSGAAVAARIVPAALGTDTGGSIRMPAAMCGIVGLRPTHGQVSRAGVLPLSWSLDAVGPMARTAEDCALIYDIIAGRDLLDATTATASPPNATIGLGKPIDGLRIGIPVDFFFDGVPDDIRACLDQAMAILRNQGAELVQLTFPDFTDLDVVQDIVREVECATVHSKWLRANPEHYADQVRARIEGGFIHMATRYCEALRLRAYWLARFAGHVFERADVLFTPTVPVRTPTIAESSEGTGVMTIIRSLGRTTRQTGYVGLPALSVPCGFDAMRMPVGFQLIGRPYGEARLLRVAHSYQRATDWHEAAPPVSDAAASGASTTCPTFPTKELA